MESTAISSFLMTKWAYELSSGSQEDHSQVTDSDYDPAPESKKRANVNTSTRLSQRLKLEELDGGVGGPAIPTQVPAVCSCL
jgi:hypothetical protein